MLLTGLHNDLYLNICRNRHRSKYLFLRRCSQNQLRGFCCCGYNQRCENTRHKRKKNCSVLVNLKEKKSFWFNFSCGRRDALYVAMTGGRVGCLRFKISNFIYFIGTYSCSARCQQSNRKKKSFGKSFASFQLFQASGKLLAVL